MSYFYILPYLRIYDKQGRKFILFDPLSCSIILYNIYKSIRKGFIRKEDLFFVSKLYWPLVAMNIVLGGKNKIIILDIMGLDSQELVFLSISKEYVSKLNETLKESMNFDVLLRRLVSYMASIHDYVVEERHVISGLIYGDSLRIISEALRESMTKNVRRGLNEMKILEKQFLIFGVNYAPKGGILIKNLIGLCRDQWSKVKRELEKISRIMAKLKTSSIIVNKLSEMFSRDGKIIQRIREQYEDFVRRVKEVVEKNTRQYRQAIGEIDENIRRLRRARSSIEVQMSSLDNEWYRLRSEVERNKRAIRSEIRDLRSRLRDVFYSYDRRRIRERIDDLERSLENIDRELQKRRDEYYSSRRRLEMEISTVDNNIRRLLAQRKDLEREMNNVIKQIYRETKYDEIERLYNEFFREYNKFVEVINKIAEGVNNVSKVLSLDKYAIDMSLGAGSSCSLILLPIFSMCIGKKDKKRIVIEPPRDIIIKKGIIWTSLELRPFPKYIERIRSYIGNLIQSDEEFKKKLINFAKKCNYSESPTFKLGIKKKLKEVLERAS